NSDAFLSFFFQAEDGIRDFHVTGVQTCALPIFGRSPQRGVALAVLVADVQPAVAPLEHPLARPVGPVQVQGAGGVGALRLAEGEIGRASWREGGCSWRV